MFFIRTYQGGTNPVFFAKNGNMFMMAINQKDLLAYMQRIGLSISNMEYSGQVVLKKYPNYLVEDLHVITNTTNPKLTNNQILEQIYEIWSKQTI